MDSGEPCAGSSSVLLKGTKLLRILRLAKLLRVLRASRIIQRWESQISMTTSTRAMTTAIVGFTIMLHWFACAWALLPQLIPPLRDEPLLAPAVEARMEVDATCTACLCDSYTGMINGSDPCRNPCLTPCEISEYAIIHGISEELVIHSESWMCRSVALGYLHPDFEKRPASTWVASLLVAMLQLLGGVGITQPGNDAESVLFVIAILVGTIVFAGVQGVVIRVLTTGNPDEMLFRQNLDALNYMMSDQRLPKETRIRVREYFLKTRSLQKRESYFELIDGCLSRKLKGDVRFLISEKVFECVPWLSQCEDGFKQTLSNFVEREAFARDEKIQGVDEEGEVRLCILDQGIASRAGTILTSGQSWGDLLITSTMLRDTRIAKALGYCEVVTLTRGALDEATSRYPASANMIRQAGLKLATQRAMIVISMYTQLRQLRHEKKMRIKRKNTISPMPPMPLKGVSQHIRNLPNGFATSDGWIGGESNGASPVAEKEEELPPLEPSEILYAMRQANILPGAAEWRNVEYTTNKEGKRMPVALHGETNALQLARRASSPNASTTNSPQLPMRMSIAPPPPVAVPSPPPGGSGGGGGGGRRAKAMAAASNASCGGVAGNVSSAPVRRQSTMGGGKSPIGSAAITGLARSQAQTAMVVEQLQEDVGLLRESLGRIEQHFGLVQAESVQPSPDLRA